MIAAAISVLAGCSLLGPARASDGRVTSSSVINSPDLLVGDCFIFVDDSHEKSTVAPCTTKHDYVVIGSGTLLDAKIAAAGGLQNAVSASCTPDFETFAAAKAEGAKPEQQFVVSSTVKDSVTVTSYLCVATAGTAEAAG